MTPKQQEIGRLLRVGLDHYGDGDAEAAVYAWNAVLALDPNNPDARDYIDSVASVDSLDLVELVDVVDEEPSTGGVALAAGEQTLLGETVQLLGEAREVDALALLESSLASAGGELDLETLAVFELVRAQLLPIYRAGFRDEAMPRAGGNSAQLEELGLSPGAIALHAACDGRTRVEALPRASGLDAFETLHQLSVLVDTGLVSLYA